MSQTTRRPALPPGYERQDRARVRYWVAADYKAHLEKFGFGPAQDGPLAPSAYAGRTPLRELRLPNGERLLLREHSHGGLLRWLTGRRFLDSERPFDELRLALELRASGIATPRLIAARATRRLPFGWTLAVLSQEVPEAIDLARLLATRQRGEGSAWPWSKLLAQLGNFLRELHAAGLYHADLQPANLLLERAALQGDAARYWVLDLDRSWRMPQSLALPLRAKNLARLLRHILRRQREQGPALSSTDLARVLCAYEPEHNLRHELHREIQRQGARGLALHRLGWWLERRMGSRRK